MTDREYVESKWQIVELIHPTFVGEEYRVHTWGPNADVTFGCTPDEAWHRFAEFTRRREEEIRQLGEEIQSVQHELKRAAVCGVSVAVWERIYIRLQRELESLKEGMK